MKLWKHFQQKSEEFASFSGRRSTAVQSSVALTVWPAISGWWPSWAGFELFLGGGLQNGTFKAEGGLGDAFGAVNSLFSGFALAAIVFTLLLQTRQLRLQIAEQRRTKRALEVQMEGALLETYLNLVAQQQRDQTGQSNQESARQEFVS